MDKQIYICKVNFLLAYALPGVQLRCFLPHLATSGHERFGHPPYAGHFGPQPLLHSSTGCAVWQELGPAHCLDSGPERHWQEVGGWGEKAFRAVVLAAAVGREDSWAPAQAAVMSTVSPDRCWGLWLRWCQGQQEP